MMDHPKILIVEDEPLAARLLELLLTSFGFTIVGTTAYGEEVLGLTERLHPDLILMDIELAGKTNGITAGQAVKIQFGVPVIYLTACVDLPTMTRARHTEPYGFIGKPFSEQDLRFAMENALQKHESETRVRQLLRRQRTILDKLDIGVLTLRDTVIESANWTAAKALGMVADDLLTQNTARIFADLSPPWPEQAELRVRFRHADNTVTERTARFERLDTQSHLCTFATNTGDSPSGGETG